MDQYRKTFPHMGYVCKFTCPKPTMNVYNGMKKMEKDEFGKFLLLIFQKHKVHFKASVEPTGFVHSTNLENNP